MCLYTAKKECFIAKENIPVLKALTNIGIRYYTSVTHFEVSLNTTITPKEDLHFYGEPNSNKYKIEEGLIHSYTAKGLPLNISNLVVTDTSVYRAYIPKGTKFYIDDDYLTLASEKLLITDKKVKKLNPSKTVSIVAQYVIDYYDQQRTKKVEVGDILLSNKTFIKPTEYAKYRSKQPIGVVGCIMSNVIYIIGLVRGLAQYEPTTLLGKSASQYCSEYETKGTKQGDWFLPCVVELKTVSWNLLRINATLSIMKKGLISSDYCWASKEVKDNTSIEPKLAKAVHMGLCLYVRTEEKHCFPVIPFLKMPIENEKNENVEN